MTYEPPAGITGPQMPDSTDAPTCTICGLPIPRSGKSGRPRATCDDTCYQLGKVIKRVRQRGGQFDEWDECFSFAHWAEAFAQEGLTIEFYATRARALDEVLPWDHIDPGVKKEYLLAERERAFAAELTPDCKLTSCRRCGACASLHTP